MRPSRRGRPEDDVQLPRKYTNRLPIAESKKADLISLCVSHVIPEDYHGFYKHLPSSGTAKDILPEPYQENEDLGSDFN